MDYIDIGYSSEGAKVRFAKPEDAEQVTKLFREVYPGYPLREFVEPKFYVKELEKDDKKFFVVEYKGNVVGHAALKLHGCNITEFGRLVVDKEHRGKGFGKMLSMARKKYANEIGSEILYTENVGTYDISQKINESLGFMPVGWCIGKYPDLFGVGHRETVCMEINDLKGKISSREKTVYIPEIYNDFANAVYSQFGSIRKIKNTNSYLDKSFEFQSYSNDNLEIAEIGLISVGEDLESLKKYIKNFEDKKHIEIQINIEDKSAKYSIEVLKDLGFFISGIIPEYRFGSSRRDVLKMQKLSNSNVINFDDITSHSEVSRFLLDKIKNDRN